MTDTDRRAQLDAALRAAGTTADVYRVVIDLGAQLAGAAAASVALLDATGEWVEVVAHRGYEDAVMDRFHRFHADADLPLAECIRTERRLVLDSRQEIIDRYNGIDDDSLPAERAASVCLPVQVDQHVVGAIGLSFDTKVELDESTRDFLEALAEGCGKAMDRTVAVTPEGARYRRMMAAARGRLAFVSAATRELSRSLDQHDVLQTLTQLVVPRFADWASILLPEGDELVAATLVHRDLPVGDLRERAGRFRCPLDTPTPSATVYRTGEPALARGIDDDLRARMAAYPELSEHLGATRDRLIVPIKHQSRILGVLTLGEGERSPFNDDDLAVAVELASRAGTALDNAARYTAERNMAEVLQRAVLPADLPDRDDLCLTARYLPATVSALVGGDWYDAFELRDGRLGLCVGDVVGHGVTAAACMGQLRNALRVYALDGDPPGEVVTALNRFTIDTSVINYTTLVYAILDPSSGRLEWTNAGHPPMVRRRDHEVEVLASGHGMPIGIMDHDYSSSDTVLAKRDLVVIYTDGLIERRDESLSDGLDRLSQAVHSYQGGDLDELVDSVLLKVAPDERADDVCILAVERADC
ncbi:MAG: SpoIIE family protein phosphatase [Acidimicrobiales bacterium]